LSSAWSQLTFAAAPLGGKPVLHVAALLAPGAPTPLGTGLSSRTGTGSSSATGTGVPLVVRTVRVTRPGGWVLRLSEVQLWTADGVNVARGGTASASSIDPYFARNPGIVIDDNFDAMFFTAADDDNTSWVQVTVTISAAATIQRIEAIKTGSDTSYHQLLDETNSVLLSGREPYED